MAAEIRPMRYLVMSGSGRAGSYNARLAELAAAAVENNGGTADRSRITDFPVPVYATASSWTTRSRSASTTTSPGSWSSSRPRSSSRA